MREDWIRAIGIKSKKKTACSFSLFCMSSKYP